MIELAKWHPRLFLAGGAVVVARFALEMMAPQYGTLFGAVVGVPLTIIVVRDHVRLKRQLRAEGLLKR